MVFNKSLLILHQITIIENMEDKWKLIEDLKIKIFDLGYCISSCLFLGEETNNKRLDIDSLKVILGHLLTLKTP